MWISIKKDIVSNTRESQICLVLTSAVAELIQKLQKLTQHDTKCLLTHFEIFNHSK